MSEIPIARNSAPVRVSVDMRAVSANCATWFGRPSGPTPDERERDHCEGWGPVGTRKLPARAKSTHLGNHHPKPFRSKVRVVNLEARDDS